MKFLVFVVIFASSYALATDISLSVSKGSNKVDNSNGGFLDLGWGYAVIADSFYGYPEGNRENNLITEKFFYININGSYQYHNFFIEAYSASVHGVHLGYKLGDSDNWSTELILSPISFYLGEKESDDWKTLNERESTLGGGVRLSYYQNRNIFQFRLLTDITNRNNGLAASLFFGRAWQYRNWNFHTLIGTTYYDDKLADYYVGVSQEEADNTAHFEQYTARGGFDSSIEFGVTYPMSENWVFRSNYRYSKLSKHAIDSPIVVRDDTFLFLTSVSYVF